MQGKTILLAVTGGIAVYKAATLASRLTQAGAHVYVLMTDGATRFVTPLTFQALTRHRVYTDTFEESDAGVISHIELADRADLFLVVPASANTISKMANGIADNMVLTTWLACTAPTIIAPAMNGHMLEHPAVQQNISKLQEMGVSFIESGVGQLACGYIGKGRLAEPDTIFAAVSNWFNEQQQLRGLRFVVTAGGTREAIDPVRFIGNHSSGKMGHAIALAAAQLGATVTLITTVAPENAPSHPAITNTFVESAQQMFEAVVSHAASADVIVKSAAVADYRPVQVHPQKIKKTEQRLVLELEKNPDILAYLGENKGNVLLVGFAAETDRLEEHAMDKLQRKRCDLLVANNVSLEGAGFSVDTNIVSVFDEQGLLKKFPLMSKRDVAIELMHLIRQKWVEKHQELHRRD